MNNLVGWQNLSTLDFDTGTNESKLVVGPPIQVLQVGFIVSEEVFSVAAGVCSVDLRQADGTVADPTGVAAFGTLTATSTTMALNTGVWLDVPTVKGYRVAYPGESIVFDVTTTATTGIVTPFVLYRVLGFGSNVDMRAHVASHPGSTDIVKAMANMTEVTA